MCQIFHVLFVFVGRSWRCQKFHFSGRRVLVSSVFFFFFSGGLSVVCYSLNETYRNFVWFAFQMSQFMSYPTWWLRDLPFLPRGWYIPCLSGLKWIILSMKARRRLSGTNRIRYETRNKSTWGLMWWKHVRRSRKTVCGGERSCSKSNPLITGRRMMLEYGTALLYSCLLCFAPSEMRVFVLIVSDCRWSPSCDTIHSSWKLNAPPQPWRFAGICR